MTDEPCQAEALAAPIEPLDKRVPAGPDLVEAFRQARARLRAQPQRGDDGRFVPGNSEAAGPLAYSEQIWALVEPARREMAARVCRDLGFDENTASEIQRGIVDNYVEARLLRESLWASLLDRGGPVTAKGNSRRVLDAYWKASDRDRDRAALLGLERRQKKVDLARALSGMDR